MLTLYKMGDNEERLTRDIDEISDTIRKKYRALKHGIRESEELLTKTYKPILTPLEIISRQLSTKTEEKVKPEKKKKIPILAEKTFEEDNTERASPSTAERTAGPSTPRFVATDVVAETPSPHANVTLEDVLATPEGRHDAQEYVERMFRGPLARRYLQMALSDERERLMDHTYGVRNVEDKWMVGNSVLEIDQDDDHLYVAGKRYKATPGLYELLFMKHPDNYSENDLAAYKSILKDTNAHKHYYLPGSRINTNKSSKYKEIIATLFPSSRPRSGRGHSMKPTTYVDYVHWNDPNELVERLRLLTGSQQAGHTGHNNEIVSILEELREASVIV